MQKVKKFLLHGLSEITFVLIGILLALQINNWNTARQQTAILKLHLINLRSNLLEDQERLGHLKFIHEFKFHGFQYLLKEAGATPYDPSIDGMETPVMKDNQIWKDEIPVGYNDDFIAKTFLWSHRVDVFNTNKTVLNEMKSTGMYSHIQNQELKSTILGYYDSWEGRLRIVMRELVEDWQKSLEQDGIITSTINTLENPILLIKDHPKRIAKVTRLARECAWWTSSAIVLTEINEELVILLDREIAKL